MRGETERTGTAQPRGEKAEGDLLHMYKYLLGGSKGEEVRLLSVVPSNRIRSNVQNPKAQETQFIHKKTQSFFTERVIKH